MKWAVSADTRWNGFLKAVSKLDHLARLEQRSSSPNGVEKHRVLKQTSGLLKENHYVALVKRTNICSPICKSAGELWLVTRALHRACNFSGFVFTFYVY